MTLRIVRTIEELRAAVRTHRSQAAVPGQAASASIGFVPTMGYLHEGHASLLRQSAEENGLTVLSIFVNPTQFGPNEDFEKYPRDEDRDTALAAAAGCDIAFIPTVAEMYPSEPVISLKVGRISDRLCGLSRPGHFDGVATVVSKLLHIVTPDKAYFGLKDAQQVAVIQKMVADLNIAAEIVPCPTVREPDGLALSSRNVYLNETERQQAAVLSRALGQVAQAVADGATALRVTALLRSAISEAPLADIEYAEVVSYPDLEPFDPERPLNRHEGALIAALAVRFGRTRLIDNVLLNHRR